MGRIAVFLFGLFLSVGVSALHSFSAFGGAITVKTTEVTINADDYRHAYGLSYTRLMYEVIEDVSEFSIPEAHSTRNFDLYLKENRVQNFAYDLCEIGQYVLAFSGVATAKTVIGPVLCFGGVAFLQISKERLNQREIILSAEADEGWKIVKIVNLQEKEASQLTTLLYPVLQEKSRHFLKENGWGAEAPSPLPIRLYPIDDRARKK